MTEKYKKNKKLRSNENSHCESVTDAKIDCSTIFGHLSFVRYKNLLTSDVFFFLSCKPSQRTELPDEKLLTETIKG